MNVQAHMSGQMAGQVPNQAGNQLPGMSRQNGNFHSQLQNIGGQNNPSVMDSQLAKMRHIMWNKIYEYLISKYPERTDIHCKRMQDISRRMEEGLFKLASSMEEYMNLDTLQSRIHLLAKNRSQQPQATQLPQFAGKSTPIGTMIPTPGMQHYGNSNMTVSSEMDPSSMSCTRRLMPTANGPSMHGGSIHAAEGSLGYQQSASSFPMSSNMNNKMVAQGVASQMIPTPGFSSCNSQTVMSVDNTSNDYSSVVPQQVPQKHVGVQNSHGLQNLGSANNRMRSFTKQRFQDGSLNSGFGNNIHMVNGSGSSDNYLTPSSFGASSRPLQQPIVMQGDIYSLGSVASSAARNHTNPSAPIGLLMNNNQNVNQLGTQSVSRSNSIVSTQSSVQASQPASYGRPQLVEQVEKLNFQSPQLPRDNNSQSSIKQCKARTHQLEQYHQNKQSSQQELAIVRSDGYVQSQMASGLSNHVNSEDGMEDQNEVFQAPASSAQFQQNSNGNPSRNSQMASVPSRSQVMMSMHSQNAQQILSPIAAQQEATFGEDDTQRNNLSHEISNSGQTVPPISAAGYHGNPQRERQFKNQQKWLLFLRHARWCRAPEGRCLESHCSHAQKLLRHMDSCNASPCALPSCYDSRKLLHHHRHCIDPSCPVCVPVKNFIHHVKVIARSNSDSRLPGLVVRSCKLSEIVDVKSKKTAMPTETIVETLETLQPSMKRLKAEHPPQFVRTESRSIFVPNTTSSSLGSQDVKLKEYGKHDNLLVKSEFADVKKETSAGSSASANGAKAEHDNLLVKSEYADIKKETSAGSSASATGVKSVNAVPSSHREDGAPVLNDISSMEIEENVKVEKKSEQMKAEEVSHSSEHEAGTKCGKPKIKGVSITELFTPEQVREHIKGLRKWVGQSKAKAEKNQAMEHSMSENSCQLCAVERLAFEPPPIYCTPCGARIKTNATYHTVGAGDTRSYICIPCYNESRGDTVVIEGTNISKSRLVKMKNDEEIEESWVQCDKCEAWQHQVCALFNGRRNDGGEAEYTCPFCYLGEVEKGERMPLPQSAVLGAKDLPRTILSDHIELRLAKRLRQERLERARAQGKSYDEVPGADGIVVRVVSSVDKKLEVKTRFLDIFRDENYPMEFPYKSKVVLLFQKIEGVEVCLFGMYVQEFGSESQHPNQRRVYLSYLDSVKYFRPDVKAVTGEALRTFVYHEILIGYLEYCKLRGFTSCYIWACPPLKGEDYILYCHPEIQKTPKSDKLREWYLAMLRKASKENIVVKLTNLYDHFFFQTGECRAKVTAARLPYFDGDYWPGAAEDMIYQINEEEEGRKINKGTTKKMVTKRALKASGQSDLCGNASKDLLMHKLGETISPMKEDFIMVHLQHACTHCCLLMVSGYRWVCNQCKKFQLCDKCYEAEQRRDDRERHPINQKDKHSLYRVEISNVPEDTKDTDEILESEFFDTRQAFLSLCQGNHYQYDTLRRAKHSSMMVLYHLHNPTAPAFVTTCNSCHLDIETGQGWRCETCPDFDVCNACYQQDEGIDHPHKLTNHPSIAERDAQNTEARQLRVVQLRKMLDLLVHASQCRSIHCQYPNCRKVKGLFQHGLQCRVRASGGCVLCKKMWYLLQLHSRACKESQCHVPRCRDLREHLRRLQQQSDSRRRAAVMEMMRQRAAEVAGNS